MSGLDITKLSKAFGDTQAVRRMSFSVEPQEIVAILGPSGCGKSTVLHLIAGLEMPDEGEIRWNSRDMASLPPHKRNFGLMFQDFALFPHMNVADNIAFGLRMRGYQAEEINSRLQETLELVGLPGFGQRAVDNLSGGERQRVALARSLAPEPELLMLDEPLGALDRTLKERLMLELPRILRRTKQTALYVTHDQEEAFAIADRVVVMQAGQLAQIGRPEQIYRQPHSKFVAKFLGLDNLLVGQAVHQDGGSRIETELGAVELSAEHRGEVTLLIRPEAASLGQGEGWQITGELIERSFRGSSQRLVVRSAGGQRFSFDFPSEAAVPELGQQITLTVPLPQGIQVLS